MLQERLHKLDRQIEALSQDNLSVEDETNYLFVSPLALGSVSLLGGMGLCLHHHYFGYHNI